MGHHHAHPSMSASRLAAALRRIRLRRDAFCRMIIECYEAYLLFDAGTEKFLGVKCGRHEGSGDLGVLTFNMLYGRHDLWYPVMYKNMQCWYGPHYAGTTQEAADTPRLLYRNDGRQVVGDSIDPAHLDPADGFVFVCEEELPGFGDSDDEIPPYDGGGGGGGDNAAASGQDAGAAPDPLVGATRLIKRQRR